MLRINSCRFSVLLNNTSLLLRAAKVQETIGNIFVWVREAGLVELDALGWSNTETKNSLFL